MVITDSHRRWSRYEHGVNLFVSHEQLTCSKTAVSSTSLPIAQRSAFEPCQHFLLRKLFMHTIFRLPIHSFFDWHSQSLPGDRSRGGPWGLATGFPIGPSTKSFRQSYYMTACSSVQTIYSCTFKSHCKIVHEMCFCVTAMSIVSNMKTVFMLETDNKIDR